MPLNELTDFPPIVSIIPKSGIQFLDFGFVVNKATPVPKDWGFYDEPKGRLNDDTMPIVVRRGDENSELAETLAVDVKRIIQTFERVWMPLPLLREELGGG